MCSTNKIALSYRVITVFMLNVALYSKLIYELLLLDTTINTKLKIQFQIRIFYDIV